MDMRVKPLDASELIEGNQVGDVVHAEPHPNEDGIIEKLRKMSSCESTRSISVINVATLEAMSSKSLDRLEYLGFYMGGYAQYLELHDFEFKNLKKAEIHYPQEMETASPGIFKAPQLEQLVLIIDSGQWGPYAKQVLESLENLKELVLEFRNSYMIHISSNRFPLNVEKLLIKMDSDTGICMEGSFPNLKSLKFETHRRFPRTYHGHLFSRVSLSISALRLIEIETRAVHFSNLELKYCPSLRSIKIDFANSLVTYSDLSSLETLSIKKSSELAKEIILKASNLRRTEYPLKAVILKLDTSIGLTKRQKRIKLGDQQPSENVKTISSIETFLDTILEELKDSKVEDCSKWWFDSSGRLRTQGYW
ncbi:hypothetical protein BN7_1684 [Wickerhamomyces ciferrii]|uniref:Uncharacterized protein n=1 Tax=Wickerhamomyces ciferrii (strain ATCC 14091 / BCRC 22168 / CBS 111 / JCM 3599 / NBRC 0793 / NRRL Y-1031 F-60-10) TaxID=1206466 RepID=K0KL33_WICCF|nr:uncharacterized protein BN7_1684 [Wickerhamomyces ciferrii]CCH42139.1 hypothetical protein BN7_1684 [Wickerhamomyces ciferrii]